MSEQEKVVISPEQRLTEYEVWYLNRCMSESKDGDLKFVIEKLLSSEQAWREEADKVLEANERLSKKVQIEAKAAYDARTQLNQAIEVLKGYADERNHKWTEKAEPAKNFLSSLSPKEEAK